jgi:rubredoxin
METGMDLYECLICGYIYNPEVGDPSGGIPAGEQFAELPEDWICPECGAAKEQFVIVQTD